MNNLQLSLKKKWFEMTKDGIKTEDYREITPYWIKRLVYDGFYIHPMTNCIEVSKGRFHPIKYFEYNIMTLGYPKSTDSDRVVKFKHKGIEIREGNPEWGAEPGKLYFVIMHGSLEKTN